VGTDIQPDPLPSVALAEKVKLRHYQQKISLAKFPDCGMLFPGESASALLAFFVSGARLPRFAPTFNLLKPQRLTLLAI
jgi:hypothetical protein